MRTALLAILFLGGFTEEDLKKKIGCEEGCTLLSVEKVKRGVVVRTRRTGHCGTVSDWTLLDPNLKLLLTIDEEVDRSCSGHEEHRKTRVILEGDTVRAGEHVWKWNGQKFVGTGSP